MYGKILVPLDGSAIAERVIPYLEPLAEKFGSALTLLKVTTPLEVLVMRANPEMEVPAIAMLDPQPLMEAEQSAAAEYLTAWSDRLRAKGYAVEFEHPPGHASAVIIEQARQLGVDLIAMTTHGRSGLGRLIMGSVTEAVLRHAPCPVLVVRVSGDEPTSTERAA